MNTVNFESISDAAGNYLLYGAASEYNFDRIAVKMLASDPPPFLAPVKIMNMYNKRIVKYETGSGKSITSIKMRMNKNECCMLIYNILQPMISCSEWLLDYHKFCMIKDYIFCGTNDFDIKYIYMLEQDFYCSDVEIINVFRDIFRNTEIIDDKDFRIDLLQTLLDDNFSINGLYEMVSDIRKGAGSVKKITPTSVPFSRTDMTPAGDSVQNRSTETAKTPSIVQKTVSKITEETIASLPFQKIDSKHEPSGIVFDDTDDMANLFPEKKKNVKTVKNQKDKNKQKSVFSLFGKNKVHDPNVGAETADTNTDITEDYTVIANPDDFTNSDETCIVNAFLNLVSSEFANCPQSIPITIKEGGTVTIGRKSANSDIANADIEFPSECSKISRKHCAIKIENGVYSICDQNSGNGTFVDGVKAENGLWIELHDGSSIEFGNKSAVYTLQINS